MAKFIDIAKCKLIDGDKDIVVEEIILLNTEEIKWIEVRKYLSGYAILAVTGEDFYVYDSGFNKENEAYIEMVALREALNK